MPGPLLAVDAPFVLYRSFYALPDSIHGPEGRPVNALLGAVNLLRTTPADRPVLTRHGDRMLLAEFTRTRVLELAVHGLDLAAALGRPPWMTPPAAQVTQDLLLSPDAAAELRAVTGWDQVTVVAKLTGRAPLSAAERQRADSVGFRPLALG